VKNQSNHRNRKPLVAGHWK